MALARIWLSYFAFIIKKSQGQGQCAQVTRTLGGGGGGRQVSDLAGVGTPILEGRSCRSGKQQRTWRVGRARGAVPVHPPGKKMKRSS